MNEMLSLSAQKELDAELNGGRRVSDLDDKLNALAVDLFGEDLNNELKRVEGRDNESPSLSQAGISDVNVSVDNGVNPFASKHDSLTNIINKTDRRKVF